MRSISRPVMYKGKFDSAVFNEMMQNVILDLSDIHGDIDQLIASSRALYKSSNLSLLSLYNSVNTINTTMLEGMLKPRYSIIRPWITNNALLIGGNSYTITPSGAAIFHRFGIITPPVLSEVSKFPDADTVTTTVSTSDTTATLSTLLYNDPKFAIRNTGWITQMDQEDVVDITVRFMIDQDTVTNLLANAIEIAPIIGSTIKTVSIIESDGSSTVIAVDITQPYILPFVERNVLGVEIIIDVDNYIRFDGLLYSGIQHLDLKRFLFSNTGLFAIDFVDPTSVVSCEFYLQDYSVGKAIEETLATTGDNITYQFIGNSISCRMGQLEVEGDIPRFIRYIKVKR